MSRRQKNCRLVTSEVLGNKMWQRQKCKKCVRLGTDSKSRCCCCGCHVRMPSLEWFYLLHLRNVQRSGSECTNTFLGHKLCMAPAKFLFGFMHTFIHTFWFFSRLSRYSICLVFFVMQRCLVLNIRFYRLNQKKNIFIWFRFLQKKQKRTRVILTCFYQNNNDE